MFRTAWKRNGCFQVVDADVARGHDGRRRLRYPDIYGERRIVFKYLGSGGIDPINHRHTHPLGQCKLMDREKVRRENSRFPLSSGVWQPLSL